MGFYFYEQNLPRLSMTQKTLNGWGLSTPGDTELEKLNSDKFFEVYSGNSKLISRGLGRSYGDAAQCSGGKTFSTQDLNSIKIESGILEVEAGASLNAILSKSVPKGWFIPVTPGTRHVTVGGAIAADVHGKNHHKKGTFSDHVVSFEIATPIGDFTCNKTTNADLFWATVGGMGLTGIIKSAKVNMTEIETSLIKVSTFKEENLEKTIERMCEVDKDNEYSVAWVDTLAKNKKLGRSIISVGNHALQSDLHQSKNDKLLEYRFEQKLKVPNKIPSGLLNKNSVRIFNALYYSKEIRKETVGLKTLSSFFYPLDFIQNWNNLYGYNGFLQYQIVVPDKNVHVIQEVIETFSELKCPIFLAVLKRMGNENEGILSFPLKGWTLALDVPTRFPNLEKILDFLDEKVISASGRVYLAKDSRMNAKSFKQMYPNWENFRSIKQKFDPKNQIQSDLSRRLMI